MNQKEYELIAGVFYLAMVQLKTTKEADYWRDLVSAMANKLELTYPKTFDRKKFIAKCGTN